MDSGGAACEGTEVDRRECGKVMFVVVYCVARKTPIPVQSATRASEIRPGNSRFV